MGNIRAALEWSFGPNGDDEIATRLAAASMSLLMELSLLIECQGWAERAIARLGEQHKNCRREMEIYTSLSFALMHTEGSSQRVREAFYRALPALFRMKGLTLASRSAEDHLEAEESLLSAIDWAKRQSATLFELKAATDLAELLPTQGRVREAYKHLSAALDRMPAGILSPAHDRSLQVLNRLQSGIKAVG